jgi:hypothetical protein
MTPLGDGNHSPYVHGTPHAKPLRWRRNCRRCERPVGKERSLFDWLCPACVTAEQSPEPRRDLRRTTVRAIRR